MDRILPHSPFSSATYSPSTEGRRHAEEAMRNVIRFKDWMTKLESGADHHPTELAQGGWKFELTCGLAGFALLALFSWAVNSGLL